MSDMKCPFCNGKLYGCIGCPYCRNEKCEMCDEPMPRELLDLLYNTRKALEIATKALDWIGNNRLAENPIRVEQLRRHARNALEQINAFSME